MAESPFARTLDVIDHDLHEQVERREQGIAEILHGCFVAERADRAIERLIEERITAAEKPTPREAVKSR